MIKDWRGTEIEVGDTVLYAVVNSSNIVINEAVVAEITTFNPGYGKDRPRIVVDWKRDSHNCDRAITRVNLSKPRNLTVIKKANEGGYYEGDYKSAVLTNGMFGRLPGTDVAVCVPGTYVSTVLYKLVQTEERHPEWDACR